jgi:hypothetical protein
LMDGMDLECTARRKRSNRQEHRLCLKRRLLPNPVLNGKIVLKKKNPSRDSIDEGSPEEKRVGPLMFVQSILRTFSEYM